MRQELQALRDQHRSLLGTAKGQEELARQAASEAKLRAEELRLLRTETEQLRGNNLEMKRKTQVELESLQEQLRVRKEKQYQLLEKAQSAEDAKRKADDAVGALEDRIKAMAAKIVELETELQVESRSKAAQEDANKQLITEEGNVRQQAMLLTKRLETAEGERLRLEAEARDAGEQLREMAQRVF